MKHFCHNAFIGLDISPSGNMKPCCKFLNSEIPKFHIKDGISQYQNSDFVKKLRSQFLKGERPKGCHRCWVEEDAGIKSKRQLDYDRHKSEFDKVDITKKDFKNISLAFGNLCNLACRICGPASSSKWASEENRIGRKKFPIHDWFKDESIMQDIFNHTQDAVHFDIPGGEPLLVEITEHFDFLSKFSNEQARNISLHYTTNGTNFPKSEFLHIWRRFREVDIQISIDDIGPRYEYNRWPAKWEQVYGNIKRLQKLERESENTRLSISFTVSAFTVFYAKRFFDWCLLEGLPRPWMGRLNHPEYYSAEILPEDVADTIKAELESSTYQEVRNLSHYLDSSKKVLLPVFKQKVNELDKARNQNFKEVFPDLASIITQNR